MAKEKKKVPNLRFKGFTDDWEQRKLGEISTSFSGGTPSVKNKSYYGGKIPFIRSAEIHKDKTELFITESGLKNSSAKLIKKGTLLYALYGATSGEVDVSNIDGAINQAIIAIFLQKDNVGFIKYYLEKNKDKILAKYLQGGQGNLSASIIKSVHINLPFTEEQLKISNLIKKVESLISLQQQKLDLLKQLKKGLLQKMFADKDSKRPVLRFKGFHDDWEQRKVSDIFTVTRGQVLATTKISEVKTNEMCFPVYSSQTKNNGLMGYYNKYLFNTAITWTTDGANAGTVNYREGKFYSTNVNGVLLSDDGYANKAIAEILDRVAWRHVSRVGNPKLMNNVMSNIKISIPSSFEEQNAISEFLIKFDHLIVLHQRKQNHLKLLKKSLLQQMFM